MSDVLLDPSAIDVALTSIADAIAARRKALGESPVLVGIRRGGDPLVRRIAARFEATTREAPAVGHVDITFYRDDAATQLPNPRIGPSYLPVSIEGRWLVLVDDVISTGRTIRAALDAVLDFGRPRRIELAVLVDRGGRELPIQPDYAGLRADVDRERRVEVIMKRRGPGATDEEPWALLVPPNPEPLSRGGSHT